MRNRCSICGAELANEVVKVCDPCIHKIVEKTLGLDPIESPTTNADLKMQMAVTAK